MLASSGTKFPSSIDQLISSELCVRLDRIDVLSRKIFAGKLQGERRSKRRGQSVEFEDYRNYIAGDDLRHVDWNVFARLDRFFVKIFQEEVDLSFHIVLDASASMDAGNPNKLIFGQRVAMSLGYVGLVNNNRVSVSIIGGAGDRAMQRLAPMRGRKNVQRLGHFLLNSARPPSGAPPSNQFTESLRAIATTRIGKGVMVVLSDFLIPEGYEEGLRLVAGGGYDTYCIQILSPGELDPAVEVAGSGQPIVLGDLKLTDAETGRSAEVTVTKSVLEQYRQSVARYIERLADFCRARDMAHLLVPSDTPLETLLLEYLRRRGLLR